MKFTFIIGFVFLFVTNSPAQRLNYDNLTGNIYVYPTSFVFPRTYDTTVEMENGAAAYWGRINENWVVKNILCLESLSLTELDPSIMIELKLFRHTGMESPVFDSSKKMYNFKGATPLSLKIKAVGGLELLSIDKDDPRFTFDFESSGDPEYLKRQYQAFYTKLLNDIAEEIKSRVDISIKQVKDLQYFYINSKDVEVTDFREMSEKVKIYFNMFPLSYSYTFDFIDHNSSVQEAISFWRTKHYSISSEDKKLRRTKFLTSYNLALVYALNGSIDSAKKWINIVKSDEVRKVYNAYESILTLEKFISFQEGNLKIFKSADEQIRQVAFDPSTKKKNMEISTSRSFKPKSFEGSSKMDVENVIGIAGYVYRSGKKTGGVFIADPAKPFDYSLIRFKADDDNAIKSLSAMTTDSIEVATDKFIATGNIFSKVLFDNAKIRLTKTPSSAFQIFIKKNSAQINKFFPGSESLNKFLSKTFTDCDFIKAQIEAGSYKKQTNEQGLLSAINDYINNCNL